nr:MFS transporter [Rhodococcus fascians]
MSTTSNLSAPRGGTQERRATLGAFIGTAIEWYDFFIFGSAAALVFGKVFFPGIAPGAALLASFATLWVGFLARPLGGMIFGHYGDKLGRRNVLVITLVMMGVATTCIGLLPTYEQIGILAPILLVVLRAVQGVAVGGEWGGAVLMATENAPTKRKALAGAWVQQGNPTGSILATVAFLIVGTLLDEQFFSWGWRIPFLVSIVLVICGLVIRLKVEESHEFVEAKKSQDVVARPVLEVFRRAPLILFLGIIASIMGIFVDLLHEHISTFVDDHDVGYRQTHYAECPARHRDRAILVAAGCRPDSRTYRRTEGYDRWTDSLDAYGRSLLLGHQFGEPHPHSDHLVHHNDGCLFVLRSPCRIPCTGIPCEHSILRHFAGISIVLDSDRWLYSIGSSVDSEQLEWKSVGCSLVLRWNAGRNNMRCLRFAPRGLPKVCSCSAPFIDKYREALVDEATYTIGGIHVDTPYSQTPRSRRARPIHARRATRHGPRN